MEITPYRINLHEHFKAAGNSYLGHSFSPSFRTKISPCKRDEGFIMTAYISEFITAAVWSLLPPSP